MKIRQVLFSTALIAVTALVTTQVASQDKAKDKGMPAMTPEQQAQFEKWMAFAAPGENHQLLQKKVGKWSGVVKMWMEPGAEPQTSNCTADIKSLWDGRYIAESVEGEGMMPGQTFFGKAIAGYDNLKKKFCWVWIDNMGTGFMTAEGSYDAPTKTFKYTYDYPDCETGKYVKGRSLERWVSNEQFVGEMYGTKDGKEFKMMEITYSRAK